MSIAKILFRGVIVNMISAVSMYNYQPKSRFVHVKPRVSDVNFTGRKAINNIIMKQDYKNHFSFFDGDIEVGYASFCESDKVSALKGFAPRDWFVEGGVSDIRGNYPLKPSVYVTEFVMDDKIGLTGYYQVRASKKKYGVMCMQKILEWAQEHGFEHRISLCPGKTHSDINPAPFYAKIGFDVSPEIADIMSTISCAKQIDGRYISRGQEVFLVEPEVLKSYPLE